MAKHGTLAGYTHGECRCEECSEAMSTYNREYRLKRIAAGLCPKCGIPFTGPRSICFECRVKASEAKRRYLARLKAKRSE